MQLGLRVCLGPLGDFYGEGLELRNILQGQIHPTTFSVYRFLHHHGQIPKIQRQQGAQQIMADHFQLCPSLDPAGLLHGKRSRPHLPPGNQGLQRARNTAGLGFPYPLPWGVCRCRDARFLRCLVLPAGVTSSGLPSLAASPVQIHHLGGLALNPSLHVTFSTVFPLFMCLW